MTDHEIAEKARIATLVRGWLQDFTRGQERLSREISTLIEGLEARPAHASTTPCGCGTGADYRFDPGCSHHSGLRAAAKARLGGTAAP